MAYVVYDKNETRKGIIMASTAMLKLEKRLDDLEARVKALEGGYVLVKPVPGLGIEQKIPLKTIPETDETKDDLPDKEIKDVEQDNRANLGNAAGEDVSKDNG